MKTPDCEKCRLGMLCKGANNNLAGWGNPNARLVILLDSPGAGYSEKLLIWLLQRCGLTGNDVWIDYLVKCEILDSKPKKDFILSAYKICWNHIERTQVTNENNVVILAGNWACKVIIGKDMKEMNGRKDLETGAWVCYAFRYLLMNPARCVDNWRIIYKAAEEAGLSPHMDLTVKPFKFPARKLL